MLIIRFPCLIIEATYLEQNHWFVNTACVVNDNTIIHTGAYVTFEKGMIGGPAKGHRINTTNTTEAEVLGVHENMQAILWMCYFLDDQGYPLRPTKVH